MVGAILTPLVTMDIGAMIRAQAKIEADRISSILARIAEIREADADLKREGLSEAGEFLALERMTAAEEGLIKLLLEPGFERYQRELRKGLAAFAEEAPKEQV